MGVTRTLGTFPASERTLTAFSGLDCVFAPARRLMASASACECENGRADQTEDGGGDAFIRGDGKLKRVTVPGGREELTTQRTCNRVGR